jgi:glycosyltransferase involved in cell wall biosynthesis
MSSLVSVIMPAYNSSRYIGEAIESVLNQTYCHTEIIVADDGSTDSTREVVAAFNLGSRLQYLYQQNEGPAAARNLAIRYAAGDFFAFLDSDDLWAPRKLEKQLQLFQNRKVGLVYSNIDCFQDGETPAGWMDPEACAGEDGEPTSPMRRGRAYEALLRQNFVPTSTVVVRKDVLDQAGRFQNEFSPNEDYELWLRIAKLHELDFIDEKLAKYRIHRNQISGNKRRVYRGLCLLYRSLLFDRKYLERQSPEKLLIARNYFLNVLKRTYASIVGM